MMKLGFRVTCIAVTVLLSGCVSYVEPTHGPTAQIRFVSAASNGASVDTFDIDSNGCISNKVKVAALGAWLRPEARKRIGLPLGEEFQDLDISEIKIPADRPFNFSMTGGSATGYVGLLCAVKVRLNPSSDIVYEARYEWDGKSCRMEINEIRKNFSGVYERGRSRAMTPLPQYCSRK